MSPLAAYSSQMGGVSLLASLLPTLQLFELLLPMLLRKGCVLFVVLEKDIGQFRKACSG